MPGADRAAKKSHRSHGRQIVTDPRCPGEIGPVRPIAEARHLIVVAPRKRPPPATKAAARKPIRIHIWSAGVAVAARYRGRRPWRFGTAAAAMGPMRLRVDCRTREAERASRADPLQSAVPSPTRAPRDQGQKDAKARGSFGWRTRWLASDKWRPEPRGHGRKDARRRSRCWKRAAPSRASIACRQVCRATAFLARFKFTFVRVAPRRLRQLQSLWHSCGWFERLDPRPIASV